MSCYNGQYIGNESQDLGGNTPAASSTVMGRALHVAEELMKGDGGLKKIHAAAIVGVFIDENGCDPKSYMKAEKQGNGSAYASGNGYGAGIASWTGEYFKRISLTQVGFGETKKIEELNIDEQITMVLGNINKNLSYYYDALKRCDKIEDASATAVIITGGIGYIPKHKRNAVWKNHPTKEDAKYIDDVYCKSNNRRYGNSGNHCNLSVRRLDYARQVLKKLD